MEETKTLRQRCHVSTGGDGDRFVGVKADTEGAAVYFPVGYGLPEQDGDLRGDIHQLFGVLTAFMKEERTVEASSGEAPRRVEFPIHAYLTVLRSFLRTGRYYVERDARFITGVKGRTDWARTVKNQRGLVQKNGALIFLNRTVRATTPNADRAITQIHRYCVYEAFEKLGWLFVPSMPEKPGPFPGIPASIHLLTKKLASTRLDGEQALFGAMRAMLVYLDRAGPVTAYSFGTERFEAVWEKMIDKAFGVADKAAYFPPARWLLDYGPDRETRPLQPDSIMVYGDKYYVLDAKYYRYGVTGNSAHLPSSADINKQITYGEYLARTRGIPGARLFNCFILPYDRAVNPFRLTGAVGNIGEAVGDWRFDAPGGALKYYERIQGIVMDTRYLMFHYIGVTDRQKQALVRCIEQAASRGPAPPPDGR